MPNDVEDQTQVDVTDKTAAGDTDVDDKVDTDTADTKVEGDDTKPAVDDSGKDREAAQFMDSLMSQYSIETPEQLKDFIGEVAGIKDALGDEDIEDLIANKNLMIRYQMQWDAAEEAKKREGETPEETIKRLDTELQKEKDLKKQEAERAKAAKENDRLINSFNTFVGKEVEALKIGDYLKPHLKKYLGVDNPIHDADISDKVTLKKLVKDAGRVFEDLEQAILKNAKVKTDDVPKMTDTDTQTAATDTAAENKPKNLAEARKEATAILKQKLMRTG